MDAREFHVSADGSSREQDYREAAEHHDTLDHGDSFLEDQLIGENAELGTERMHFLVVPHTLVLEFKGDGFPDMVVLFAELFEFVEYRDVQVFEEGRCLCQLTFLDFVKCITEDSRLLFDVEQG